MGALLIHAHRRKGVAWTEPEGVLAAAGEKGTGANGGPDPEDSGDPEPIFGIEALASLPGDRAGAATLRLPAMPITGVWDSTMHGTGAGQRV